MEVELRGFGPARHLVVIRDALADSTLWPSVAVVLGRGLRGPARAGGTRPLPADRRQEVVTLGALRDGVHCDADAPYVAQHRLFDQIPELRDGLGATFWVSRRGDAVAMQSGRARAGRRRRVTIPPNLSTTSWASFCGSKRVAALAAVEHRADQGSSHYDVVAPCSTRSSCRAAGGTASIPCRVRAAPCPCRCGSTTRLEPARRLFSNGLGRRWTACFVTKILNEQGGKKALQPRFPPPGAPRRRGTRAALGAWTWRRRGCADDYTRRPRGPSRRPPGTTSWPPAL